MRCAIIPPVILDEASKHGPEEARRRARRSLVLTIEAGLKREQRPVVEPQQGEQRHVHDAEEGTALPGTSKRAEDAPATADAAVNEAYDGSGLVWDYYFRHHRRRSLDGQDATLISTVHYDKDFDNAFWDGQIMVYGDGSIFNRFTAALTVIGHELTHGIVQHTCRLVYRNQPGALNEHLADAFSCLIEQEHLGHEAHQATWLVGAELFAGRVQGRALRDMLHPGTAYDDPVIGKDPQPDHMGQLYTGAGDNGGVHINSGIPNRAFAHAALTVGGKAWETVGPVWYDVMARPRIGSQASFQTFANATRTAAVELYGAGHAVETAIVQAWSLVGIAAVVGAPEPEPDPGQESPCELELLALLRDPAARPHLIALGQHPTIRRLVVRARQATL